MAGSEMVDVHLVVGVMDGAGHFAERIGKEIRVQRAASGGNGYVYVLGPVRQLIDLSGDVHPAARRQRLPRRLQPRRQGRLQFRVDQQIGQAQMDFHAVAGRVGVRSAPGLEFAALVAALEVAELPVVRQDFQYAADLFERIREDIVTDGGIVKADRDVVGGLLLACLTAYLGQEIALTGRMKGLRHLLIFRRQCLAQLLVQRQVRAPDIDVDRRVGGCPVTSPRT